MDIKAFVSAQLPYTFSRPSCLSPAILYYLLYKCLLLPQFLGATALRVCKTSTLNFSGSLNVNKPVPYAGYIVVFRPNVTQTQILSFIGDVKGQGM